MNRFLDRLRLEKQSGNAALAAPDQGWGPLDLCTDGIVLLDAQWTVTAANAPALELLQSTLSAVLTQEIWDILPEALAESQQDAAEQALRAAASYSFVDHQAFADRWIEYHFRRYAQGYVLNLKDVGERQKLRHLLTNAERYNQAVFVGSPQPMWCFYTASLEIFAVNQAALSFYRAPQKLFLKQSVTALFPDGEGAAWLDGLKVNMREQRAHEAPSALSLCRQQTLDGEPFLVELAWHPISWNEQSAVLVSVVDVSSRYLADSGLQQANAELELTLAARQDELQDVRHDLLAFTQAISSDLRDSLHAADGFAVRLAEKYAAALEQPGRHYVQRIQASIAQLSRLVDDLRTLAQLSQRARGPEIFDLVPLCQALVAELRKKEPVRTAMVELPAELVLCADKRMLGTALACLLENAWKFTSKKTEAWIKVGLTPGTQAGELILEVSDNGAGFDPAYSKQLFVACQRLHSSADFPGNGLGLAIVKRVAELHDGRVWAQSSEQAGASFFMALAGAKPLDVPAPQDVKQR